MTTDWNKLKVVDLKAELKRRGLPQNGLKQELAKRLAESDAAITNNAADAEPKGGADIQQAVDIEKAGDFEVTESESASQPPTNGIHQPVAAQLRDPEPESGPRVDRVAPSEDPQPTASVAAEPFIHPDPNGKPSRESLVFSQDTASQLSTVAPAEIERDIQARKRRSRSPPPPSQDSRKRARLSSEDGTQPDGPAGGATRFIPNGASPEEAEMSASPIASDRMTLSANTVVSETRNVRELTATERDSRSDNRWGTLDNDHAIDEAHSAGDGRYSENVLKEKAPADREPRKSDNPLDTDPLVEERAVAPSIHPATSALYIRNFMRPLRPLVVQEYLAELATPGDRSPDHNLILDFYLDQIRTHAFVVFASVSAASRVRMALHDRVWPDESNRKPLWVDFVPTDNVKGWVETEQSDGGGRSGLRRWEIAYREDETGSTVASLEEAGPETSRAPWPPVAPAVSKPPVETLPPTIPTGPSRPFAGIERAPLGPRADRMGNRTASGAHTPEGWNRTRAVPSVLYKPVSDLVAQRRLDNMHSYKASDPHRDVTAQFNRYTFENSDSFVDRGKEVFIGIRPPHRERERQRGLTGAPPRGPPPPPSYPRGDRQPGGRADVPRSRLDGNPLPTYSARGPGPNRWRRDSYRDRRY